MTIVVSKDDLRKIIVTDADDATLDIFIKAGIAVVTKNLVPLDMMDDDYLSQIALFLSAHFLCAKERQLQSEEFGDSKETYFKMGEGFASTTYGQMALNLDYTGTLLGLGDSVGIASFEVF